MSNTNGKHLIICPNPSIDILSMIDTFTPGAPTRIKSEVRYPGGKGVHVSMALSELGLKHELWAIWGRENETYLKDQVLSYFPTTTFGGPTVEGWIRSCYSFITDNEWKDTELLGAGPQSSLNQVQYFTHYIQEAAKTITSVAVCGSWPKGSPENATAEIVKTCNRFNIRSYIDASGVQMKNALQERPYAIHLNKREVCDLTGLPFKEAISDIKSQCEIAAITDGKNGLYFVTKDQSLHANVTLNQKVISTIGSGDCLTAGMIYANERGLDIKEIAKWAVACGAANCIRPELGMIHRADVEALFDRVNVEPI